MGRGKSDMSAPVGDDQPEAQLRVMLHTVVEATDRLIAALDAAGFNKQLRESPAGQLRILDRSLPNYTLDELLLICEAYAAVTAPTALAMGDPARAHDEARRVLHLFQALSGALRPASQTRTTNAPTAQTTQSALLRSALSTTNIQIAITELIHALSALATVNASEPEKRKRLLPLPLLNTGCLVPGTVLGGAMILIIILITSIALVTGQVSIAPNSVPVISSKQEATATYMTGASTPVTKTTPTANQQPAATHSPATATPIPAAAPTATSMATPRLSISKSTVTPCQNTPDTFTISYSGGQRQITWTATWSDSTNIMLNPTQGALSSGAYTTVTVSVQTDVGLTGTITITPSNGLPAQTLMYNSTNC